MIRNARWRGGVVYTLKQRTGQTMRLRAQSVNDWGLRGLMSAEILGSHRYSRSWLLDHQIGGLLTRLVDFSRSLDN